MEKKARFFIMILFFLKLILLMAKLALKLHFIYDFFKRAISAFKRAHSAKGAFILYLLYRIKCTGSTKQNRTFLIFAIHSVDGIFVANFTYSIIFIEFKKLGWSL
jgi:hypothetical protein